MLEKGNRRSVRRHHKFRIRNKARWSCRVFYRVYSNGYYGKDNETELKKAIKAANKDADHFSVCSCPMCGNPRRFNKGKHKFTMQERKYKFEKDD